MNQRDGLGRFLGHFAAVREGTRRPICECWFLDVGQGSSNVILLGGGRAIVLDCGPKGSGETLDLLRDRHVDTIEALIISHNDADHDYNAPGVLTQYRKAIHRIFFLQDRDVQEMKRTFAILKEAREGDYPCPQRLEANGGEPRILFSADGVVLSVMYPDLMSNLAAQNPGKARPNRTSAILCLSCDGRRVVFGGDAPNEAWEYLSSKMPNEKPLECDIMAIPHHGGKVTNGLPDQDDAQEKLYSKIIRPEYGIVSVGSNNQYGHPSDVTIAALRKAGVKVLCAQMTEKCSDDLEGIRHMRSMVSRPARSRAEVTKTRAGKSKHVACYGSIIAEISSEKVKISGFSRWQEDFRKFAGVTAFHPLCKADSQEPEEATEQEILGHVEKIGHFDFLNDPAEDIYGLDDGEAV